MNSITGKVTVTLQKNFSTRMLGHKKNAVAAFSPERPRQMLILAGHIGVNEKNIHVS